MLPGLALNAWPQVVLWPQPPSSRDLRCVLPCPTPALQLSGMPVVPQTQRRLTLSSSSCSQVANLHSFKSKLLKPSSAPSLSHIRADRDMRLSISKWFQFAPAVHSHCLLDSTPHTPPFPTTQASIVSLLLHLSKLLLPWLLAWLPRPIRAVVPKWGAHDNPKRGGEGRKAKVCFYFHLTNSELNLTKDQTDLVPLAGSLSGSA